MEPAQSYACSIAAKVDNYTKNLPATINDAVGNVVAKTSESIKNIEGSNGEEIITSVFSKATTAIRHFKNSRVLALFKYLLIFTVLAIFFGRRKLKRIQKKEEVNASVQDNTKSIE